MKISNSLTRRQFLRYSAAGAGATLVLPYIGYTQGANDQISVACIGVGGKGDSDVDDSARCGGKIVALCDVDEKTLNRKAQKYPEAKKYKDFRKMLDEMGKSIDAVTVSTPDHVHGVACGMAMKMGKHIYCQKPLVQTVYEARALRRLANEKKLATQMGNQGSAGSGLRRAVEVIQGGVIGPVTELHVWSNRPIWPQVRMKCRRNWTGICGWDRLPNGRSRRVSITPSPGGVGMISAPARSATWLAIPSTCRSAHSRWVTRMSLNAKKPASCSKRPIPRPRASALTFPRAKACRR
jgi:hypothetical protein